MLGKFVFKKLFFNWEHHIVTQSIFTLRGGKFFYHIVQKHHCKKSNFESFPVKFEKLTRAKCKAQSIVSCFTNYSRVKAKPR